MRRCCGRCRNWSGPEAADSQAIRREVDLDSPGLRDHAVRPLRQRTADHQRCLAKLVIYVDAAGNRV